MTQAEAAKTDGKIRPKGIGHIGIQTPQMQPIIDWYCTVLNAWKVYEQPGRFALLAFDDDHHRIAIAGLPPQPYGKSAGTPEYAHVAFDMGSLQDLLETWERLDAKGIKPTTTLNHGPTVSLYFHDPDGNECELFVDCFPTKAEVIAWFESPVFQHSFGIGPAFDPADWLKRLRAGESPESLLKFDVEQGMAVDVPAFAAGMIQELNEKVRRFEQAVAEKVKAESAASGASNKA